MLCYLHRLDLVGDDDVHHSVRSLHFDWPNLGGLEYPETTTLDHRWSAHSDVRVLSGDHNIAAAENRSITGKAIPGVDTNQRNSPGQLSEPQKSEAIEPADSETVCIARSPTAAFGEEDNRKPQLLSDLEQPILLAMILRSLGSGKHRVVV